MPDGQARADNFTVPDRLPRTASATAQLKPRVALDNFDRSSRPIPKPAPLVPVPDFWEAKLSNGVDVIGARSSEIPLVTLRLSFEGGHLLDDADKYGLAALTATMMNEGTEKLSAEQFEIELDKLGSRISVGAGSDSTDITLVSLTDKLDATLALLEQRLFESKFTEEDLTRLRQQEIEGLEADKKQPSSIASNVYRKLLYGEAHPFSVSSSGTKESLEAITLTDIEHFSHANLNSGTSKNDSS